MNSEINLSTIGFSNIEYLAPASRSATYKSYNIPKGVKKGYITVCYSTSYNSPSAYTFGGTAYTSNTYLAYIAGDGYSSYFATSGYTWEIKFTGEAGTFTLYTPFDSSSTRYSTIVALFIVYD